MSLIDKTTKNERNQYNPKINLNFILLTISQNAKT